MLKWSRDRLAPRADMTTSRLARFEQGSASLTHEELGRIAEVLEEAGVTLSVPDNAAGRKCRAP
jgi:hypothetical protein